MKLAWRLIGAGAALGACAGFILRDLLPLEAASAWVPFSLAGAVVWPTRLRPTMVSLVLLAALLWVVVGFTPLTAGIIRPLVRQDARGSADAVFVLASRLQRDGDPSPVAQTRLLHGLELLAQEGAPRLVLSDLPPPAPPHSERAQGQIDRLRLQGREIVSLGVAQSTREEALRVGALCRERGWRRLVVVSSPLHSRRACGALEHEGLDVVCSPAVETEFDVQSLSRPVDRFAAFRQAVHELVALWIYRRRGWL